MLAISCKKKEQVPVLTTIDVKTSSNAWGINSGFKMITTSGGKIISIGSSPISVCGICISNIENPTIDNDTTCDQIIYNSPNGTTFHSYLKNLSYNSVYYVRAYAINMTGIGYGNQVSFTYQVITDINDYDYYTVKIGNQTWMISNLHSTLYNDGTEIPHFSFKIMDGPPSPGYCTLNDSEDGNGDMTYYNWYAVNTGKLCPIGWHVPSNNDWFNLIDQLGGTEVAGGKLKNTGNDYCCDSWWPYPNTGATNESLFSAEPMGGTWNKKNSGNAFFWSKDQSSASDAFVLILYYDSTSVGIRTESKSAGLSLRCIEN